MRSAAGGSPVACGVVAFAGARPLPAAPFPPLGCVHWFNTRSELRAEFVLARSEFSLHALDHSLNLLSETSETGNRIYIQADH